MLRTMLAALTMAGTIEPAWASDALEQLRRLAPEAELSAPRASGAPATAPAASGVALAPLINGTDVSAAIGTYRMDTPQFGCPMTVYARYENGRFAVWTDQESSMTRRSKGFHGESDDMPRFHFMSTGQSHAFYKYKGGRFASYERSALTRVAASGGSLSLYQESLRGMSNTALFSTSYDGEHETSRKTISFSLAEDGSMTLWSRQNDRRSEPPVCTFRKTSTETGPAARRLVPYTFEARVLVDGKAGVLHADFDLEEFTAFERDTRLRNFAWTIALDGGKTLAPERPLRGGDWRKEQSGFLSPGASPLRPMVHQGAIIGLDVSAMIRPLQDPFILELEAGASTVLDGNEQLLRLFMACDKTLTSCELIPSAIDGNDPGFFAPPIMRTTYPDREAGPRRADFPVRLDGDTLIQLKPR